MSLTWAICRTNRGVVNIVRRLKSLSTSPLWVRLNGFAEYDSFTINYMQSISVFTPLYPHWPGSPPIHPFARSSQHQLSSPDACMCTISLGSFTFINSLNNLKWIQTGSWQPMVSYRIYAMRKFSATSNCLFERNCSPNDFGCLFRHNVWLSPV